MTDERIRVVLVDDHDAIRAGLFMMLAKYDDIAVVGEAADGKTAIAVVRSTRPDLVLMDLRMPRIDGIEATRTLAAEGFAVLVLTTFDLDDLVISAVKAGAAGYLLKTVGSAELADAIRRVRSGDSVLAPEVTRAVLRQLTGGSPLAPAAPPDDPQAAALASLTPREGEILGALAAGLSNAGLAERFQISETTAKTHVSRILTKLGCRSRLEAAALYTRLG